MVQPGLAALKAASCSWISSPQSRISLLETPLHTAVHLRQGSLSFVQEMTSEDTSRITAATATINLFIQQEFKRSTDCYKITPISHNAAALAATAVPPSLSGTAAY